MPITWVAQLIAGTLAILGISLNDLPTWMRFVVVLVAIVATLVLQVLTHQTARVKSEHQAAVAVKTADAGVKTAEAQARTAEAHATIATAAGTGALGVPQLDTSAAPAPPPAPASPAPAPGNIRPINGTTT